MNTVAYEERQKNQKHIQKFQRGEYTVLEIDTNKVTWRGHPYASLNAYNKRKFENDLVLQTPKERLKMIYHG